MISATDKPILLLSLQQIVETHKEAQRVLDGHLGKQDVHLKIKTRSAKGHPSNRQVEEGCP